MTDPDGTVFKGFWHGPPLGHLRQACLSSFVELGHEFHLYTYDQVDIPPGVVRKDANEVIPREELFLHRNLKSGLEDPGPFSDLFRFRLLSEHGGWWCDVDTVCLSPDIPEVEAAWAAALPEINDRAVGTGQIALSPGSRLANTLYSECLLLTGKPLEDREAVGPRLLSRVIEELGLPASRFGSAETFYPVRWIEAFKLWLPDFYDEVCEKTDGAMFLALYQSLPQYLGMDLTKLPPDGSYLDRLYERFGMNESGVGRHDPDDIVRSVRRFMADQDWAMEELEAVGGESTMRTLGLR